VSAITSSAGTARAHRWCKRARFLMAVCGNDDLKVFADRYRSRLIVALLAALNTPVASRFIANRCNFFELGAKLGILLFDKALFSRLWQFTSFASC